MPSTPASPLVASYYQSVQAARAALLAYCDTLAPAHFTAPVEAFRHGSMRDLLLHVADAYHIWLGWVALGRPYPPRTATEVPHVAAMRELFGEVDALVANYVRHFDNQWLVEQPFTVRRQPAPLLLTPWQIFTHATTHEFHHKGQLLTMSRLLGYEPVDTDVIRF
jgi:uncharacterized damage-inducible protein DinB